MNRINRMNQSIIMHDACLKLSDFKSTGRETEDCSGTMLSVVASYLPYELMSTSKFDVVARHGFL
jgi:hypothetical protein